MRIRRSTLLALASPFVILIAAAYIQWATVGLPELPPSSYPLLHTAQPQGFPAWLRTRTSPFFYSFGEGLEGGLYYDTHSVANLMHPQSLLAYEMNFKPLPSLHGAPLRLRVENQLGFKMVKWIRAIEFVESAGSVGEGEGGYNEDHEYFGELANI